MAKKPPAASTPRKRTSSKKKPNGEIDSNAGSVAIAPEDQAPAGPTDEDIRVRAYHRYLERGAGHGGDFDDWVEAEKDLKSSRS